MKNIRLLLIIGLALLGRPAFVSAQDAFFSPEKSFHFKPLRQSSCFIQEGEVRLNLYGEDKAHSGKFRIPTELMYRYIYTDTVSVIGKLDPLVMARIEDFFYVSEICLKAQADCRANYKTWKASTFGTLCLTIVNPVAGLALAIPTTMTPPRIENLGMSDVDMLQEDIYFYTYRREAKKLKSKRAWAAYGIGLGVHLGIVFGIIAAVQ